MSVYSVKMTDSTFYALVYGDHWEDIQYFSSFNKACAKLIIQSRFIEDSGFYPMIFGYKQDPLNENGTYGRTKNMLCVMKIDELKRFDEAAIMENPMIAFHLVESIL